MYREEKKCCLLESKWKIKYDLLHLCIRIYIYMNVFTYIHMFSYLKAVEQKRPDVLKGPCADTTFYFRFSLSRIHIYRYIHAELHA